MEVDEALGRLGTWGRWQVLYFTMLCTACMFPACFHMLAIVFIGRLLLSVNTYKKTAASGYCFWRRLSVSVRKKSRNRLIRNWCNLVGICPMVEARGIWK